MKLLQTSSVDYKLTLSYIKLFILIIITILNFLNLNEAVFSVINSALYAVSNLPNTWSPCQKTVDYIT